MQDKTFTGTFESSYEENVFLFNFNQTKKERKKQKKQGKKQKKTKKFWRGIINKIIDAAISIVVEAAMCFFKRKYATA